MLSSMEGLLLTAAALWLVGFTTLAWVVIIYVVFVTVATY